MSWISENKIPAAIIGVSAVGAIALGAVLFTTYSGYSTSLESFDSLKGKINTLKSAQLSPTPQNLEAKKGVVGEYSAKVDQLSQVLHALQLRDVPTTAPEFQAKLKAKIAATRKLAAEGRLQLPPEFNLAFDKYTAELPKSDETATQLSTYLDAVDELVHLLIDSGILRLELLQRADLPTESSTAKPKAPTPPPAPKGKKGAPARPTAPAAAKITERLQVTMTVSSDQDGLQKLLSKLASPSDTAKVPYYPVVRLLRIENERQDGPPVQGVPVDPNAIVAEPPKDPKKPQSTGTQPAKPDAIIIMGNEKLRAYLEIDLVKFL